MDFAEQLGERIRAIRISRGMRQEDLAAKAGISRTHLSRIEKGRFDMQLVTLGLVCKGLGVQPDELMRGVKILDV
jgi:transcriptional regulator with XRE-family HTH domain